MDGNVASLTASGLTVVTVGICTVLVRNYLRDVKKDLQDIFDRQVANCTRRFDGVEAEDKEIWSAFNAHGHKGLDKNGSMVTR